MLDGVRRVRLMLDTARLPPVRSSARTERYRMAEVRAAELKVVEQRATSVHGSTLPSIRSSHLSKEPLWSAAPVVRREPAGRSTLRDRRASVGEP